ncbi:MAG: leucine-rich repeat protein, partial [Intestinibacter sp.]
TVGSDAFNGCSNVTIYGYPQSYIQTYAQENNINFVELAIPLEKGFEYIVSESGSEVCITGCTRNETDIVIPSEIKGMAVTSISSNAFSNSNITSVKIPSTVESIGFFAFKNCKSLTEVQLQEGLKSMSQGVFEGCTSLESIEIPSTLMSIPVYAFCGCTELKNVKIPEGVKSIRLDAFYMCTSIRSIEIPNSMVTISSESFDSCVNLKSITIPNKETKLEDNALKNCRYVTIYGYTGSKAEAYAQKYSLEFVDLSNKITVKFDPNNGEDIIEKDTQNTTALDYTPSAPIKDGFVFVGWYKDIDDITTEYKSGATYTENTTYKAKWAHVQMLGAQVKAIVNNHSGIRFGTKIYNDGDEIVEKGTLILPYVLLAEGEALTLDISNAAKSMGKINYEVNEQENYVTYLGTLINIPSNQFDTKMTAAAYVIYRDKTGNEYTVYSQYKNSFTTVNKLLGK